MQEEIVCPKCLSNQISANQKGFNTTNAVLGNMTGGAALGIGLGMLGSNRIRVTCLKCGNQFNAGDGSVKKVEDDGSITIEKQEYVDKEKVLGKRIAVILLILLIIVVIGIAIFFNSLKTSNTTPIVDQSNTQTESVTKDNETRLIFKSNAKTRGYFVGTKRFCNREREDDCYRVTITENGEISISDLTDPDAVVTKGTIAGKKIVDVNGKEILVRYKPYHFYMKREDRWVDFDELK